MIRGAGGVNAAGEAGIQGYEALSPEILLSAFPDWLLLTDGNVEASGGLEEILGFQGLNATPAVRSNQVIVFDTAYLLNLSVRTGAALMDLAAQLHPSMTWEREISYPYSFTDATGTTLTLEAAPSLIVANNPTLLELTRGLGFHSELADAAPAGALILAAQSEEAVWRPLRDSGALVVVLSDAMSIEEVAVALNAPGRGLALLARLGE
jgi:ABC-type Fe3+-hydroxamate transport system substrate-binding protein